MNKFAYEAGAQQALVDSGLLSKEAMEVPAWLASAITGTGNVAKKTWGATRDFAQRGGRLAKDLYAKHPYEIAGGGGALAGAGVGALASDENPGLGALAGAGIGGGLGLGGMRLLKLLQAGAARKAEGAVGAAGLRDASFTPSTEEQMAEVLRNLRGAGG